MRHGGACSNLEQRQTDRETVFVRRLTRPPAPAPAALLRPGGRMSSTVKQHFDDAVRLGWSFVNGTLDGNKHPGLKKKSGHIGFLGHDAHVEFRNIYVREMK